MVNIGCVQNGRQSMKRFKYDVKKMESELNRIGSPKRYRFPLKEIFENDYSIILSIRQDAGKTTTALLYGLLLHKMYNTTIEYLRNDDTQIRRAKIETLFKTVLRYDYISKIYNNRWNSIIYSYMQKKFFLCLKDSDGNVIEEDKEPVCCVHSNEEWLDLKSSYNSPFGDWIILDEAMDSHRMTCNLWTEFMNNISTIGRVLSDEERASKCHVIILGNNTDKYAWVFQDFCISDLIPDLKYGALIKFRTELGTTGFASLMEQSEIQKEKLRNKNIPFFGFNTPKAAQFIGTSEWVTKEYLHPDFYVDYDNCYFRRMYIYHRHRYIQINLFYDNERKKYAFLHFAAEPLKQDNVILTLEPKTYCEFYGICEFEDNKRVQELVRKVFRLKRENRWYYSSNLIGELVDDYLKNI